MTPIVTMRIVRLFVFILHLLSVVLTPTSGTDSRFNTTIHLLTTSEAAAAADPSSPTTDTTRMTTAANTEVTPATSTPLPPDDTMPALFLPAIQKLQKLGYYASSLNVTLSTLCVRDLKYFEDDLTRMEMWALQMADAMGKIKPGLMKGQTTLVGDYDQCREISREISSSHTIVGQFCRLGVKVNVNTLGLNQDKIALLNSFLSNIVVHTCLPNTCSERDVLHLFPGIFDFGDMAGAVSSSDSAECVHLKHASHDNNFLAAMGVFTLLACLCLVGTAVEQFFYFRRRINKCDAEVKATLTNGAHLENGEVLKEKHFPNRAFEERAQETPSVVSQEVLTVDEAQTSPSAQVSEQGTPPSEEIGVAAEAETVNVAPRIRTENGNSKGFSANLSNPEANSPVAKDRKDPLWIKLITSFSVIKNGRSLLNFRQGEGDLGCIHGVRVISRIWQVFFRCFVMHGDTQGNKMDRYRLMSDWTMMPLVSGTFAMDNFFFMSGLFTSYLFLRQVQKIGGLTKRGMVLYYLTKLWRLTPQYMMVVAYEGCIAYYTWRGPFDQDRPVSQNCRTYWWYNILYINNLFPPDRSCLEVSWYIANDMQFYVVAPLALFPWIFKKQKTGCIVALSFVAMQIASTGYIVYTDQSTLWFTNKADYYSSVYVKPWCRASSFYIGLMLGYGLSHTRCQYKMQKVSVIVGWTLAAVVSMTVVYVPHDNVKDLASTSLPTWGPAQNAAYEALSRPLWISSMAWVVWACCTGYGGFVNRLLSWKLLIPFSRLSYGLFLLHITVFYTFARNTMDTFYVNAFTGTQLAICVTVISYMASFILLLLTEAPTFELEKVLLSKSK